MKMKFKKINLQALKYKGILYEARNQSILAPPFSVTMELHTLAH